MLTSVIADTFYAVLVTVKCSVSTGRNFFLGYNFTRGQKFECSRFVSKMQQLQSNFGSTKHLITLQ